MWECAEMYRSQLEIVIVEAISNVEDKLTCRSGVNALPQVKCKTVMHNLCICVQWPSMYLSVHRDVESREKG